MSYSVIEKDITTVDDGVIAHGVNCQGVMGSGVAKFIRAKYPHVYERYNAYTLRFDKSSELLGKCLIIKATDDMKVVVANCYTQQFYGKDGKQYADLDAVMESLEQACIFASATGKPLYVPRIGCGLGGLDWDTQVGPIVNSLTLHHHIETFVCDHTP